MSVNSGSKECQQSINTTSSECQQSVNDFGYWILYNPRAVLRQISIINVLAAFQCKSDHNMVEALLWIWASTERQQVSVLRHVQSKGCAMVFIHNRSIGSLYRQYCVSQYCYTSKWASTERQQRINRASTERQPSINTVTTECPQSVNPLGCCIMYNPRALLLYIPIINELAAILGKCHRGMVTTPVSKSASTERQQFCVLHVV